MSRTGEQPTDADRERVAHLLGREPRSAYTVAVRGADGAPVVLRNLPVMDDGTPMPTLYWLIGPAEVTAVSVLEAAGGVDEAEAAVGLEAIDDIHRRYAAERDTLVPPDHRGPAPFGGVGGTRRGVKCLHAHFAWWLAGGDDAVGAWTAARLAEANARVTVRP